jgi:phosphatidylglycerophosphate synthase
MKNIPNIITSARLIAAISLLAATLRSSDCGLACFVPLFVIGGISDLFDGYVARRFGWCTEFGARLDSVSDLSIYGATAVFL